MSKANKDNRAHLALLAATEMMALMAMMVGAVALVLLALLVHVVSLAHRGLPDPRAPLVRKVPPGHKVQPGSREHREQLVRQAKWDQLVRMARQDRRAGLGTTSKLFRSTNGNR